MVKNKILLIEDDTEVIFWIKDYFEEYGYILSIVDTVTDAISNIKMNKYDLILLDIGLPDFYGYEVLNHINANKKDIPIIVISGFNDYKNKLYAFKLGASDYMTKPLNLEELEARIRVHTKSNYQDTPINNELFKIINNTIYFNETALKFTKTEYEICKKLINNKNIVLDRDFLCESLSSLTSNRTLDYHIRNIRKKLGDNTVNPKYIITEYGRGYKLVC